jgi:N-acetylglucosamine malate deacetylase 2
MRKLVWLALMGAAFAQQPRRALPPVWTPPRVLIVVAHPDDESCFAATTYRIAKELGGTVDQAVITNGEGGFRYSLLAEPYYGVKLTDEAVGRAHLPAIRKQELLEAGKVLGIRRHYFLEQKDEHYTQDAHEVLERTWDRKRVLGRLEKLLAEGGYDFVFTLFPDPETHGAHKAATILALQAAEAQPAEQRPIVLGCEDSARADAKPAVFRGLDDYPITQPLAAAPSLQFDRAVKFGFRNALDYQIIVNWVIAAYKSQGLFQRGYNKYDLEDFALYAADGEGAVARTEQLFEKLKRAPEQ